MLTALTTSTATQHDKKGRGFMRKVGAAYDEAGLDEREAQRLNESPGFVRELSAIIEKHSRREGNFQFVTAFDITVPDGYDHATRLAVFFKEHGSEFDSFDSEGITDEHYHKATTKLVEGRKLKVKIFWITPENAVIKDHVTVEECLAFLKSQKAILVGAQGLSLVYELAKDKLPKCYWYLSFDEMDALWQAPAWQNILTPAIPDLYSGDARFLLNTCTHHGLGLSSTYCLLCFCDA